MKSRIAALMIATSVALSACGTESLLDPISEPNALIGGSPLKPLVDPMTFDVLYYTDPKSGEVTRWIQVEFGADWSLFAEPIDPALAFRTSATFSVDPKGDPVAAVDPKVDPVSAIDPKTDPTASIDPRVDPHALVVIALPITDGTWSKVEAALQLGVVHVEVVTAVGETTRGGDFDVFDSLGAIALADPRPSPLPPPPEWLN